MLLVSQKMFLDFRAIWKERGVLSISVFFFFFKALCSCQMEKWVCARTEWALWNQRCQGAPVHSIPYNGLASAGSDRNPNGTVSNDLEMPSKEYRVNRVAVYRRRAGRPAIPFQKGSFKRALSIHPIDWLNDADSHTIPFSSSLFLFLCPSVLQQQLQVEWKRFSLPW